MKTCKPCHESKPREVCAPSAAGRRVTTSPSTLTTTTPAAPCEACCFRCNNAVGDLGDDLDRVQALHTSLLEHDPEMIEMAALVDERLAGLVATAR